MYFFIWNKYKYMRMQRKKILFKIADIKSKTFFENFFFIFKMS